MTPQPYPGYKDSGVEWLGKVPTYWRYGKITRFARLESGHTPSRQKPEYWEDCSIPWFTLGDVWQIRDGKQQYISETAEQVSERGLENSSARLLPAGTVILSRTASVGFSAIMSVPMATSQDFADWVCGSDLQPEYLYFCLTGMHGEFQRLMMGSTHQTIYMPDIASLTIALPPLPEQSAIAAFLDRETGKIDALIAEQEKLIELLREKRQTVISHAVTKGLDPTAPMKDSGIQWLGEVPAHWGIVPLMRLTADDRPIMYGIVLPGPNVEEGVLIIKGGDVKEHRLQAELLCRTTEEIEAPFARARLRENDIVYSIRGTIGDAELVPAELSDANITQDVARISPRYGLNFVWLLNAIKSDPVFVQLKQRSLGAAVPGVNIFDLKRARIPLPPAREQADIACFLDSETKRINSLITESQRAIDLLKERRAALISAAVTGKIDVRGLVETEPSEAA